MKSLSHEELSYTGFIVKPSGFKGEFILGLEAIDVDQFPDAEFVFLSLEGLPVPFQVEDIQVRNGNLVLKLKDIDSEAAAKKVAGTKVYLEESFESTDDLPAYDDLIGFEVTDDLHGLIGTIHSVEELPMQFVATCTYQGKDVLFPLNESIVHTIDPEQKKIRVQLPEGLLDVYLKNDEDGVDEEESGGSD